MVEPIDPVERGEFDRIDRAPRSTSVDDLGLVETDDRLGLGVVIRVAAAADRGLDPGVGETFGVANREVPLASMWCPGGADRTKAGARAL